MRNDKWKLTGALVCVMLWVVPMTAKVGTGTETSKSKTTSVKATRKAWPPEHLAGTIMMVDPAQNLVVVKGPENVPFDMKVSRGTRIEAGNQPVKLADLSSDLNRQVQVYFRPERSGDVAQSIKLQK